MSSEKAEPGRDLNHCRNFSLVPSKFVEFIVLLNDERIVRKVGTDKTFFGEGTTLHNVATIFNSIQQVRLNNLTAFYFHH
jgi:hypothetical protein